VGRLVEELEDIEEADDSGGFEDCIEVL